MDDTREALAALVSAIYRHPAAGLTMIAITGTNGKTTVSYLIDQALQGEGFTTGIIGTIEYRYKNLSGDWCIVPAPLTTPDPLALQSILREMADNGVTHVVMETSSHALAQHRLDSIGFDLAIFTNLSQDHLDYHGTMENYFSAKCLLFERLMRPRGTVVVTRSETGSGAEDWAAKVVDVCRAADLKILSCGSNEDSDVRLLDYSTSMHGVSCRLAVCSRLRSGALCCSARSRPGSARKDRSCPVVRESNGTAACDRRLCPYTGCTGEGAFSFEKS
ncbi:MAG: Mur ligase family protein [Desulfofustis sp.]